MKENVDTHELHLPELGWVKAREITCADNTRTRKFAVSRLSYPPDGNDWAGKSVEVRGPNMDGAWIISHNALPKAVSNQANAIEYLVDLEPAEAD